jgi:hypothetical protein
VPLIQDFILIFEYSVIPERAEHVSGIRPEPVGFRKYLMNLEEILSAASFHGQRHCTPEPFGFVEYFLNPTGSGLMPDNAFTQEPSGFVQYFLNPSGSGRGISGMTISTFLALYWSGIRNAYLANLSTSQVIRVSASPTSHLLSLTIRRATQCWNSA